MGNMNIHIENWAPNMNIHITWLTYVRSGPKKKKSRPRHSFNDVTDHVYVHYTNQVFRANGGHVVERDDIRPLLLQNAAVGHL